MSKKSQQANLEQVLEALRSHGFATEGSKTVAGGVVVSKGGVATIVCVGEPVEVAVGAGLQVEGELARLVDRGYQKFLATSKFELPATEARLKAIHAFSEEFRLVTGLDSLFNQSLGSTSDSYRYDRVHGRESAPEHNPVRPWDAAGAH